MAPASLVLRLDAAAVDPATVAYLRDLVDALQGKCFHLACASQIAGDATNDLFRLRPEPSLLLLVPDEVASAVNALEELLRKGSAGLAAYGRHVVRLKRAKQEELLVAAMAELESVDDVVVHQYGLFVATRAHLLAAQCAKQGLMNQIAAAVFSPLVNDEERLAAALVTLLPRLGEAHEREAVLEMAVRRMLLNFLTLSWHLEVAKARVDAIEAALEAMPNLPAGSWADDVQLVCDGTARFEESVEVLRQFMA